MNHLWLVAGLGLAGIDPVGMLLLFHFLTGGLSRGRALLFGGTTLVGTTLLGAGLSLLLGSTLQRLSGMLENLPNAVWVWFNAALVVALVLWGVYRLRHPEHHEKKAEKTPTALLPALLFLLFTPLMDPSFVGMLALSAQRSGLLQTVLDAFLWTLISQSPLFLLTGAVMFGVHEKAVQMIQDFRTRHQHRIHAAVTILIFLAAALFLVDLAVYWISGVWLMQ